MRIIILWGRIIILWGFISRICWSTRGEVVSNKVMNSSSFLLCLVFAAIGYVIHPMILPSLVDSELIAESSLSESYREEQAEKTGKDQPESEDDGQEQVKPEPEKPDIVEQPDPDPVAIPTPEPAPVIESDPAPDEPKVEPVVTLSEEEVINILKASVQARDVNEFEINDVISWKQADDELIGSDTFQVGMVTYKADTIFDEQQLEAKAIIKDGKVVKWLWPTTNTQMR
jgi:hypothetical protein